MIPNSFADKVSRIVTSQYNQNYTLIITGGTGSGKSYAGISLAMAIAAKVAKIKGGRPSDYFEVDRCMSVIDIWRFFDVLESAKKYNIVILDDAGVGINARKFMDTINITINNISQTYRTLNLCTIITVPEMYFVDRVIRSLVDALCEMDGMVAPNLSRGRLFEIQRKSRLGSGGKLFYIYPRGNQEKTIGITFEKPPDDICVRYETLRATAAEEYRIKSIEQLREGEAKLAEKKGKVSEKKGKLAAVKSHIANGDSKTRACAKEDISVTYFNTLCEKEKVLTTTT